MYACRTSGEVMQRCVSIHKDFRRHWDEDCPSHASKYKGSFCHPWPCQFIDNASTRSSKGDRDGGWGEGWKVTQVMRCRGALLSSMSRETSLNTHTHKHTQLSGLLQDQWGSGRRQRRRGVIERGSVCVCRKTVILRGREEGGDGWKGLYGDVIFSPGCSLFSFPRLCPSFVQPCPWEQAQAAALSHGAGDESSPTKSLWGGSVCFCLEGGTHRALPGKRQPAVCSGLRASPPPRWDRAMDPLCVCDWALG